MTSVALGMPALPAPTLAPRRPTRKIKVGSVYVGGDAPVSVQSMCTTKTEDVNSTLQQIAELTASGCDIVRVACPTQDAELISRWEQLLRFAALRLGRELGADVQVQLSRKELADPGLRFASQAQSLVDTGCLTGTLRIPDAIAPLDLVVDLRAGRVTASVDVDAPREGRAATRVNWLTRQLKDAPDGLRVDGFTAGARTSTSELLRAVRDDAGVLVLDPKKDFRMFRLAATSSMGTKRGTGRGGFIDSVLASIDGFYEAVVQQLRPWSAKAPQLPRGGRTAAEEAGIDIEPPPGDLDEPVEPEVIGPVPPEDEPTPSVVEHAVDSVAQREPETERSSESDLDEPERPEAPASAGEEFVSWAAAHDRIDHERDAERP